MSLQVYDVTKFLDDHPGGDDVLIHASGNQFFFNPKIQLSKL